MNLTDRIYLAVHVALALLACTRHDVVAHRWWYVAWSVLVILAIVSLARKQDDGNFWELAHDWLPSVLFITVFEQVSFLSLVFRGEWQNSHLAALESMLFAVPPGEWLRRYSAPWFTELLEFGYFSFYPLYPAVAGTLWAWRGRPEFAGAFRRLTDSLSVGYLACYTVYLVFPTRSPYHNLGLNNAFPVPSHGPFHFLVRLIQGNAGVRGNAFPSAHIMLAFAVLVFVGRYFPRILPWLSVCVLLMCIGAVYDGYHYLSDVIAGAVVGVTAGVAFAGRATGNRWWPAPEA